MKRHLSIAILLIISVLIFMFYRFANAEYVEYEVRYLTQIDAEYLANVAIVNDIHIVSISPSHELRALEKTMRFGLYTNDGNKSWLLRTHLKALQMRNRSPNVRIIEYKECHLSREVWCWLWFTDCTCAKPYK